MVESSKNWQWGFSELKNPMYFLDSLNCIIIDRSAVFRTDLFALSWGHCFNNNLCSSQFDPGTTEMQCGFLPPEGSEIHQKCTLIKSILSTLFTQSWEKPFFILFPMLNYTNYIPKCGLPESGLPRVESIQWERPPLV